MNASIPTGNSEAEAIRAVQRERSAALLSGDMQAAERVHADDFQLVTPLGSRFLEGAHEKREGRWQIVWSQGTGITE